MKRKNLKEDAANVEDILEKERVNIPKNKNSSLDRNTIEKLEEERYPGQALKKEFEVSLHFSEEVQNVSDSAGEWIMILKDVYIKQYLEERKRKEKNR